MGKTVVGYFYIPEHGSGNFYSLAVILTPSIHFEPPTVISSGARNLNCLHGISFLPEPVPKGKISPFGPNDKKRGDFNVSLTFSN